MFSPTHPQSPSWPMTSFAGAGALVLVCAAIAYAVAGAPASAVAAGEAGAAATAVAAEDSGATGAAVVAEDSGATGAAVVAEDDGAAVVADEGGASGAALRGAGASQQPAPALATPLPNRRRCSGCGVVIAAREAADGVSDGGGMSTASPADFGSQWPVAAPPRYIFTVHLEDGSKRLINDLNPLAWRIGERVMIIDGSPANGR